MILFPAVDLYEGKAVRLYKGDYSRMTVYESDPLRAVLRFRDAGAEWIHLVDLEGARDGTTPNLETVLRLKTESGLLYKVITLGKGKVPAKTDRVKVNYRGTLIDGTELDSSYKRNEPAVFRANQVIPGWTEALTMMPVGSHWMLYIPQDLAYGERNQGTIKPFSTLIFDVEVLGIEE